MKNFTQSPPPTWLEMFQEEQQKMQPEFEKRLQREEERERIYETECRLHSLHCNSIHHFMTEYPFRGGAKLTTGSQELYDTYCRWCYAQDVFPKSMHTLCVELTAMGDLYRISPAKCIRQGKQVRGFRGIGILTGQDT